MGRAGLQRRVAQVDRLWEQPVLLYTGGVAALANRQAHDGLVFAGLPGLHAQSIPALQREVVQRDTFGPAGVCDQECIARPGQQRRSGDGITLTQLNAHHTRRYQPHRAHFVFCEADCHPACGNQQDFVAPAAQPGPGQAVVLIQPYQREGVGGCTG